MINCVKTVFFCFFIVQCSLELDQRLLVSSSLMSSTLWLPAGGEVETLEESWTGLWRGEGGQFVFMLLNKPALRTLMLSTRISLSTGWCRSCWLSSTV